ncbi:hypothetical protein D3C86_1855970 [compost metagenome]
MCGKIGQRLVQRHAEHAEAEQLPEMPCDQLPLPPNPGQQPGAEQHKGQQPAVEGNGRRIDSADRQAIDHGAAGADQRGQHGQDIEHGTTESSTGVDPAA